MNLTSSTLATEFEQAVVSPIHLNELLGAILVQLTPYVKRIEHGYRTDNLEKLDAFFNKLHTDDYSYFVEFRHVSWLDVTRQDLEPGIKEVLERNNVGLCIVDGPSFPTVITDSVTRSGAYIRLHGRNTEEWFKKHKGEGPAVETVRLYVHRGGTRAMERADNTDEGRFRRYQAYLGLFQQPSARQRTS